MGTECSSETGFIFQRKLTVDFAGGAITTEGGLPLVREFDERLGLSARLVELVADRRDARYVDHGMQSLLRQRIYQIVAGYEDCNDATYLREEPTMQAVAGEPGQVLPHSRRCRDGRTRRTGTRFGCWRVKGPSGSVSTERARVRSSWTWTPPRTRPTGSSSSHSTTDTTTRTCTTRC